MVSPQLPHRGRLHHECYRDIMKRTTISFEEPTLKRLRQVAAERETSIAEFIRDAVEEKLATMRPKPKSLGAGASGFSDTARRAGEEWPEPPPWRSSSTLVRSTRRLIATTRIIVPAAG